MEVEPVGVNFTISFLMNNEISHMNPSFDYF